MDDEISGSFEVAGQICIFKIVPPDDSCPIAHAVCEWSSGSPPSKDEMTAAEWLKYRMGRQEVVANAARKMGLPVNSALIVDV